MERDGGGGGGGVGEAGGGADLSTGHRAGAQAQLEDGVSGGRDNDGGLH